MLKTIPFQHESPTFLYLIYLQGDFWKKHAFLFSYLSCFILFLSFVPVVQTEWFLHTQNNRPERRKCCVLGNHEGWGCPHRQWCRVLICLTFPLFLFASWSHKMWLWPQQRMGRVEIFPSLGMPVFPSRGNELGMGVSQAFHWNEVLKMQERFLSKRWGQRCSSLRRTIWLKAYG